MESFERGIDPKRAMDIGINVKEIIEGLINVNPIYFCNSNGPDDYCCPFCRNRVWDGDTMEEIKHDDDCLYLKAKKIHGKL